MAGSLAYLRDPLATHPIAQSFDIRLLDFSQEFLQLELCARDELAAAAASSAGYCALLMDYGARKLGYEVIGCCCVNECEISIHQRATAQKWRLEIQLESLGKSDASFSCQLFCVVGELQLAAECQGSLIRT